MNDLKVVKRDGNIEDWSQDKLIAALGRAGIPGEDAVQMASRVHDWAMESALDGKIESTKVRDKIIEELKTVFPAQADSFQAYKK